MRQMTMSETKEIKLENMDNQEQAKVLVTRDHVENSAEE